MHVPRIFFYGITNFPVLYGPSHRQKHLSRCIQLFRGRLSEKNVHATIPKGNMGYDQYTVPETLAVEFTFVVFLYFILLGLNLPGGGREIGCND